MVFTEILENFVKILEKIPSNLKTMCMLLLFFLSTIEIALTVYTNIDNENFSYYKWLKSKVLKIGFIIFAIKQYEWLLTGVKDFFLSIGKVGLGISLNENDYFNDPSAIWDKGREIGGLILDQVGLSPSTYVFLLLGVIAYIGFFMLSIQIIICWVEYYFLSGISIVFLAFGALEMTGEFYKNVFKTIISCSIKLSVFNIWLLICDKLMKNVMTPNRTYDLDDALVVCGTVYILVTVMLSMPSLTTGLLTGSPTINAGQAMSSAMAAGAGLATTVKETIKGAFEGAKKGGDVGGSSGAAIGGAIAGPVGMSVGKIVGGTIGAVGGATIGGSYAGARYAIFKEKGKDKVDNNDSDNTSSESSSSGSGNSGGSSNNGSTSQSATNSSGNSNSGSNSQPSSNSSSSGSSNGSSSLSSGNSGESLNNETTSQITSNSNDGTNSVVDNSTPANTNIDTTNNVSESSPNTPNTTSTDTITSSENGNNVATTDTGDSSEKRGIKVNGGAAGKLPDWMDGDY